VLLPWRGGCRRGHGRLYLAATSSLTLCSVAAAQTPDSARQESAPASVPEASPPAGGLDLPAKEAGGEAPPESVVAANERNDRGVSLGLRLGWGFPAGLLSKGDSLSSNLSGMVPVWIDAGYRLSHQIYLGVFFQWGVALVANQSCPANLSCSAKDIRFGIDAHLGLGDLLGISARLPIDPWVGIGAGYEITSVDLAAAGTTASVTYRGFEFGNVQLGIDYTGFGALRVGGFFTTTLARYSQLTQEVATGSRDFTPDQGFHLWLIAGVRGRYDF
jgi:hypothetical protein